LEERATLQEAVRTSPRSNAAVEHTLKKREAEIKALERELKNAQQETDKQVAAAVAQIRRELESSSGNKSDQIEDLHKELAEAIDDRDAARAQIDILANQSGHQAAGEMSRLQRELDESEASVRERESEREPPGLAQPNPPPASPCIYTTHSRPNPVGGTR